MATVIDKVPNRSYLLRLEDGKKIFISEGGLGGPMGLPVTIGVFRWSAWLGPLNLFRPLWRWDISAVRTAENSEEAVGNLLRAVMTQLVHCNNIQEVTAACRPISLA
jgi:hypothetical protein